MPRPQPRRPRHLNRLIGTLAVFMDALAKLVNAVQRLHTM